MPEPIPVALPGLFAPTLEHFPNLQAALPDWWSASDNTTAAITWATRLAAQAQPAQPVLSQRKQRVTIFTRIFPPQNPNPERFIPLAPLHTTHLMPQTKIANTATAYEDLLSSLRTELAACRPLSPADYLISAGDVLRRHTWCLPSPYDSGPEAAVSLYDHSRIVAALAPCYRPDLTPETPVATFISGDISGIQDFIYTITARGAASGLRGRSFYLQLLTDALATYILAELDDLPPTSIIYAGGGHFYLLVPGDQTARVTQLQARISQKLLRHHRDLYVGLGCTILTESDFEAANFPKVWQRLGRSVSQAKNRRYSELGEGMFSALFKPEKRGGDKETECRVCHYEGNDPETEFVIDETRLDDENDPLRKCLMCDSLEKLGNNLRRAQYLLKETIPPQPAVNRATWQDTLAEFGVRITLADDRQALADHKNQAEVWALSDEALAEIRSDFGRYPLRLQYIVNATPVVTKKDREEFLSDHPEASEEEKPTEGHVKSFTLLQAQAQGIKRLGVLRMDVDDLGRIFQRGFGDQSGLVQTAALSSAMSLYFEAWITHLIQEVDTENREVLYSIYSGGDDLFIVGAWDLLPELARRIATDLQAYAAGNPHIHASAGITLHGGKFPLYQAAAAAEEALDKKAKNYTDADGRHKNAFTFLDRTYGWPAYDMILADQQMLIQLVSRRDVGRTLLQHLQQLDALYQAHVQEQIKQGAEDPYVYWGRGQWLHAYQMSRLAGRLKGAEKEVARTEILQLRDKLRHDNFTHIQVVGLSARWAELATRHEREVETDATEDK